MFVNMLYPRAAKYTNTSGVESYSNGAIAGRAIKGDIEYEYDNGGKLYGDGALIDDGKQIIGGTVKVGVTRLTPTMRYFVRRTYACCRYKPEKLRPRRRCLSKKATNRTKSVTDS